MATLSSCENSMVSMQRIGDFFLCKYCYDGINCNNKNKSTNCAFRIHRPQISISLSQFQYTGAPVYLSFFGIYWIYFTLLRSCMLYKMYIKVSILNSFIVD